MHLFNSGNFYSIIPVTFFILNSFYICTLTSPDILPEDILLYKKDFLFIRESLMKHTIEELSFNERVGRALSSQFISEHPGGKRHSYQSNHHHRQ